MNNRCGTKYAIEYYFLCGFIISTVFMNGCAVGMAAYGKKQKDTTVLIHGTSREDVIKVLGKPSSSFINDKGKPVDLWVITRGNEPSGLRALLHGSLDIITFGFWEIIGTPLEAFSTKEDKYQYLVTYDENNRIISTNAVPIKKYISSD